MAGQESTARRTLTNVADMVLKHALSGADASTWTARSAASVTNLFIMAELVSSNMLATTAPIHVVTAPHASHTAT